MFLYEVFAHPPIGGLQDVNDDNSKPTWKTSRNTKLTLKQIRKLRRMVDVRSYEKNKYLQKIRTQYGAKPADEAGGLGPTL